MGKADWMEGESASVGLEGRGKVRPNRGSGWRLGKDLIHSCSSIDTLSLLYMYYYEEMVNYFNF